MDGAARTPDGGGERLRGRAERCPDCRGTGFVVVERDGERAARRCRCALEHRRRLRLDRAGIPRRYADCTLENFVTGTQPSLAMAHRLACHLVRRGPNAEQGLVLAGPCGVGKTHLAVGILRAMIDSYGVRGLFAEFSRLLRRIQDTYDRRSETPSWEVIEPAMTADVLVLDDLGATRSTPWVRDTLGLIVGERYDSRRLTVITTNYLESPPAGEESLAERIGERLASRLAEMCRSVVIEADDWRRGMRDSHHPPLA